MPRLPGFFFSVKIRWFEGVFVRTLVTARHSECITKSWHVTKNVVLKMLHYACRFSGGGTHLKLWLSIILTLPLGCITAFDILFFMMGTIWSFRSIYTSYSVSFLSLCLFIICLRILKARVQQKVECYEVLWINVALGETCPSSFITMETRQVGTGGFHIN